MKLITLFFSLIVVLLMGCEGETKHANHNAATGSPETPLPAQVQQQAQVNIGDWVTTTKGIYQLRATPLEPDARMSQLHRWSVMVRQADGQPAAVEYLNFDGGMPQHAHGFTTSPTVTGRLENDAFLVEGVKFHMGGEWTLRFEVYGSLGSDYVEFVIAI